MSVLSEFTCNTCGLLFPGADLQRQHMKSEWHRYNLKRRVADLGPVSAEAFAEKSLQQERLQREPKSTRPSEAGNDRVLGGPSRRQVTKKDIKRKERLERRLAHQHLEADAQSDTVSSTFTVESSNKGDFDDLTAAGLSDTESQVSVKPRSRQSSETEHGEHDTLQDISPEVLRRLETLDFSKESPEAYEALLNRIKKRHHRAIPPTTCLLDDNKHFGSVQENVDHLFKKYGLFVPEKEYLTDLEGLMTYLGEKVGIGHMCIYCNFHGKSISSVRDHMIMKSHVKIPYETLDDKLELVDFYDFTSTYAPRQDDEGWEDIAEGSAESDSSTNENEEPEEPETALIHGSGNYLTGNQGDMYVDDSGVQLVIAPGVRVGHRSQLRYFKQSLGRGLNVQESRSTILAADRRNGLVRAPPPDKHERRIWKQQRIAESKVTQREKNLNFQAHYRDQLLQ